MLIVSSLLSGQQTKIYERWPSVSACPLTTKTSRFRNTRSMAKAKGMCNYVACPHWRHMYARSIAYVECGSTANAAVIKEWLDNKYVDLCLGYYHAHLCFEVISKIGGRPQILRAHLKGTLSEPFRRVSPPHTHLARSPLFSANGL
jgi:hypothetical protein